MEALDIFAEGLAFAECPRWHDSMLHVSDMWDRTVYRIEKSGTRSIACRLARDDPGGTGWLPGGDMLVVAMAERRVLRLGDGGIAVHADLSGHTRGLCNDMAVSAAGVAYISQHGYDLRGGEAFEPTSIIAVAPDGTIGQAADGLRLPNGIAIDATGTRLAVAESLGGCVSLFAIASDGSLSNRKLVIVPEAEGTDMCSPDGLCFDAAGAIWFADPIGRRVVRLAFDDDGDGAVDTVIPIDGHPLAVVLGGEDRRTLFVCVVDQMFKRLRTASRTARILTTSVPVAGGGVP